jgi:hypothetical protein
MMSRWESRALAGIYAAIALISVVSIYVIYQAAQVIGRANTAIDSQLYFQTHVATLAAEIVLWVIIARAAVHLKAYTRVVADSTDGRALGLIADAFLVSLVYAVSFGLASTIKTLFYNSPYLDAATTFTNLMPLVAVLLFAITLFKGSVQLMGIVSVKCRLFSSWSHFTTVALYAVASILFAWYLYRTAPSITDDDGLRHFALSSPVLLVTYIIPYMAVWLLGLLSCINIGYYGKRVQGLLYRPLFRDVYRGLVISFIGIFLAQIFYLADVQSNRFGPGLLLVFGVITFLIYGCYLVYRGTSQLSQIED